jgi:hypothetical protein
MRSWWDGSTSATTIPVRGQVPAESQRTTWIWCIEFTCPTAEILVAAADRNTDHHGRTERLARRSRAAHSIIVRHLTVSVPGTQVEPTRFQWLDCVVELGHLALPDGRPRRRVGEIDWGSIRCGQEIEMPSQAGDVTTLWICVAKDDTYNARGRWLVKQDCALDLPPAFRELAGPR